MLNLIQVIEKTGYSKGHIYHRIKKGTFPKSQLENGLAMWDEKEIDSFMKCKQRLVMEFDEQTGEALDDLAGLMNNPIPDAVTILLIEAIKTRTTKNPLYPIAWNEIEKRGIALKDYIEIYCNYIRGLKGDKNIRFDIRQGTMPKSVLLRDHKIMPLAQREAMSIRDMESMEYKVVAVYEVEEK